MKNSVLITGSNGYLGQALIKRLATQYPVVGIDIQPDSAIDKPSYSYHCCDIRSPKLSTIMAKHNVAQVVHLASVMNPGENPAQDFDIDINGTENVINACINQQVNHLVVTSSGAAYGYHADNPLWLVESDPLRGHPAFSYSEHKRLIEQRLEQLRKSHPQIRQLVLRPGTVLGKHTNNLITGLFHRRSLLKIKGAESPFVFIWDQDVIEIMLRGIENQLTGTYNLAGDGALSIDQIAEVLDKPLLTLPVWLLKTALSVAKPLGISPYGPEQVDFLRYRPVLSNQALKQSFGYTPAMTSREVFEYFAKHQGLIS